MWLATQVRPQLQAPLSLLLGYLGVATVSTLLEANKLARRALVWAQTPLRTFVHEEMSVIGWSDASWELVGETIPLQRWQEAAAQIPSALVLDSRGVYDALARSESACLGLKDKRSGLEALSLKRSLVETRCGLRWTH